MPFLLLLLLMVACLPVRWPAPPIWAGDSGAIYLTWSAVAITVILALLIARQMRRDVRQNPILRERAIQRYSSWRFYHLLSLFAAFGLGLYVFGWGGVVQTLCAIGEADADGLPVIVPGAELLILA